MHRQKDEKKALFGHLEELRRRVLFSIISVVALSALSYIYAEKILKALAVHVKSLVFISPQEAFLAYVKIAILSGVVLSAPVILFNAFKFVRVALNRQEKNLFAAYVALGTLLFAGGALFSYYIALPQAMRFLLGFGSDFLRPYISVSRYISFSAFLILAFAVAFEIPLVVVFLTKVGLLRAEILQKKRKYFIVLMFVIAAMLTPPDFVTQVLLAIPMVLLYEVSILFARVAEKR